MSHVVTIKTQMKDQAAVQAACRRLQLPEMTHGEHALFAGQTATGWAVQLPGWLYPIVIQPDGNVAFDNYGGQWGEQKELDKFLQAYACEKTKIEVRRQGHSVKEQTLGDGSVKLVVTVAG